MNGPIFSYNQVLWYDTIFWEIDSKILLLDGGGTVAAARQCSSQYGRYGASGPAGGIRIS